MSATARTVALGILAASTAGCPESKVDIRVPRAPEQITVVGGEGHVAVYWESVPGAGSYRVTFSTDPDPEESAEVVVVEVEQNFAGDGLFFREVNDATGGYVTVASRAGNAFSDPSPPVAGWFVPDDISVEPVWSMTMPGSGFGSAITGAGDVDGDGFEDVVIGAPGASTVYLLRGSRSGIAPGIETITRGSAFGSSVAFSPTFLAGQPAVLVGDPGDGEVAVYEYAGATLSERHVFSAPLASSEFGASVAAAGNLDGANPVYEEIAVGAPLAPGGGAVYVYEGSALLGSGGMIEIVMEPPATDEARFGAALAAVGNLGTDPADDLAIGAPLLDVLVPDAGGVSVLLGGPLLFAGGGAPEPVVLDLLGDEPGGRFGTAIASIGDMDADDQDEFLVGAPGGDCDGGGKADTLSGRIAMIELTAGPILAEVHGACGPDGSETGTHLEYAGSWVGANTEYVIAGAGSDGGMSTWTTNYDDQIGAFQLSSAARTGFGSVVAVSDVNGDGFPDVLVGAPASDTAYLYVTLPDRSPEVHAGPPVDALAGIPMSLDAVFVSDIEGNSFECTIEWRVGEPGAEGFVFDSTQLGGDPYGCTAETLRGAVTVYDSPGEGDADFEDHVVRVTVFGRDGRNGQGITRVRVRP